MRDAQWVVIDRFWLDAGTLRWVFPRMRDTDPPERRAFERVVASAFEPVYASTHFELRQRRRVGPPPTACDAIGDPA